MTVAVKLEPFATSAPPVIVRPPLRVEAAATVNDPPLIEIGSLAVSEWTD